METPESEKQVQEVVPNQPDEALNAITAVIAAVGPLADTYFNLENRKIDLDKTRIEEQAKFLPLQMQTQERLQQEHNRQQRYRWVFIFIVLIVVLIFFGFLLREGHKDVMGDIIKVILGIIAGAGGTYLFKGHKKINETE